jgi:hypothetical protein
MVALDVNPRFSEGRVSAQGRALLVFVFAFGVFSSGWLRAGVGSSVAYDLREGSLIRDECLFCDRAPIEKPLRGSFVLTATAINGSSQAYGVTELQFHDPDGQYAGNGSGTYILSFLSETNQEMALDLEINGTSGIKLASKSSIAEAPQPAIEITLSETGERDPGHVITLRLVTAPTVKMVPYELEEGSTLTDECRSPCKRLTILAPIAGTFLLGEIAGAPNPTSTYRVDGIEFLSTANFNYKVTGSGFYRQGGEVAVLQRMDLTVNVNETAGVHLTSDAGTVGVPFPEIAIDVTQKDPQTLVVYSLHLLARPSKGPPPFRRGDVNSDASSDISDAVFTLLWLFAGGKPPPCADAADTNDDEKHDVSDAVFLLQFLFQGGTAPPAPGPFDCGAGLTPSTGCDSSSC